MSNYYGYRCYDDKDNAVGWLCDFDDATDLTFTARHFDICKRWKTERGAKKNFDYYNERWKFRKGGYLKIEIMPEKLFESYEPQQKRFQRNLENSVWSVQIKGEIQEWLELERKKDDSGDIETDTALINRKLEKLMELEKQGY